jgi:hypothetical protein
MDLPVSLCQFSGRVLLVINTASACGYAPQYEEREGEIVRDVIRGDANNPFLKGTSYGEIALIWGWMLSLLLTWYANFLDYKPNEISLAVVVTLIGALLTRMAIFYLGVKSPMY